MEKASLVIEMWGLRGSYQSYAVVMWEPLSTYLQIIRI